MDHRATGRTPGFCQEEKAEAAAGECLGHGLHWGFHRKEARECRVSSLGSSRLNNFGKLWAIGVVLRCLVTWPWNDKAKGYCHQWCMYSIEEACLWAG